MHIPSIFLLRGWFLLFSFFCLNTVSVPPLCISAKYTPCVDVAGLGNEKLILHVRQRRAPPLFLLANVDTKEKKRIHLEVKTKTVAIVNTNHTNPCLSTTFYFIWTYMYLLNGAHSCFPCHQKLGLLSPRCFCSKSFIALFDSLELQILLSIINKWSDFHVQHQWARKMHKTLVSYRVRCVFQS